MWNLRKMWRAKQKIRFNVSAGVILILASCQAQAAPISTPAASLADTPVAAESTSNLPTATAGMDLTALLQTFPLYQGTSWTYTKASYSQASGDPNSILRATTRIHEQVVEVENHPPYYLAHVQGKQSLEQADPGWEQEGPGDYEYWYIVLNGSVYRSEGPPDLSSLDTGLLQEVYRFPMAQGDSWCPKGQQKDDINSPAATPYPCEYAGMRMVEAAQSYVSPAGKFDTCWQLWDRYTSGSPIQIFCAGVGVVETKYDHGGTHFGWQQVLDSYTLGSH
jgi:hypothetical protein